MFPMKKDVRSDELFYKNDTRVTDLEYNFHGHAAKLVGIYLMKESEISVTSEKRTDNIMSETERWHFD